jgi:hypothetical protein
MSLFDEHSLHYFCVQLYKVDMGIRTALDSVGLGAAVTHASCLHAAISVPSAIFCLKIT